MTFLQGDQISTCLWCLLPRFIGSKLTGIYNRRKIDQKLSITFSDLDKVGGVLSVILFDIDKFKTVNDTYGHLVGDKVLVELSRTVLSHIDENDLFGRWGGEEFIIVCPGKVKEEAYRFAEMIRQNLSAHDFPDVEQITCSFGISQSDGEIGIDQCLSYADEALYKAKENGRNRVELYSSSSK